MASLEELMAGLFGGNVAPGAEDPRRRRAGGAGGGAELFSQFLPFLQGLPSYDYSGPGRGLAGMLNDRMGPAARHFQNIGVEPSQLPPGLAGQDQLPPGLAGRDDLPPGLDNRRAPGGANVAPGNIETGTAVFQPQGRALGQSQVPRTQGWLNVAPGYAIAAGRGFGTDAYNRGPIQQVGPGAEGGVRGGGGGSKAQIDTREFGGGFGNIPETRDAGSSRAGGGGIASAGGGGGGGGRPGRNRGGRGGGGPRRGGNAGGARNNRQAVRRGTASPGTNVRPNQVRPGNINQNTGGPQTNAGQPVVFGPGVGGPIVQVAQGPPNNGNNNTPSETRPPARPTAGSTRPTQPSAREIEARRGRAL